VTFQDVPLFGEPQAEAPAKDRHTRNEEHNKVSWQKFKPAGRWQCDHCRREFLAQERTDIAEPVWVRGHLGMTLYLCRGHAQTQRDRDQLDGLT
jgi:hypothetical protein